MKILNKYRFIRGAKGDDPPTPALVPPPDNQNVLKSMSVSNSIDILCEGPIYGLVDQFGKKVYGLDMLKGIYLNKVPAMNASGEYNFRNILMEINLGTENQKPLVNFDKVFIYKPANFKLLGRINPNDKDERVDPNKNAPKRDFTAWAKQGGGGWPTQAQDSFVYVHHIKNKDVKKIQIAFIIEQLSDTISEGTGPGKAGKMGMNKRSNLELMIKYGVEGAKTFSAKTVIIDGLVLSPYAYMVGDESSTVNSPPGVGINPSTLANSLFNTFSLPSARGVGPITVGAGLAGGRGVGNSSSQETLREMIRQLQQGE
jgi:hypothetical protein